MTHYRSGIILAIVALVIAVGTPAFSAKPVPTPKPIIQSVLVQTNTLQINGANFGATPMVTLYGTTLTDITTNDTGTQIGASLTSLPAAGTYKLTVVVGTQSAEFYVTIGAVGQVGPPGPAGAGNLGVYDGNEVFLGVLIRADKGGYEVFNPDIPAFLYLSTKQNPPAFTPVSGNQCGYDHFAFTTDTCEGHIYVLTAGWAGGVEVQGCGLHDLIRNSHTGLYYILDTSLPILKQSDLYSIYWAGDGQIWQTCRTDMYSFGGLPDNTAFPVKEIPTPELFTTPLQYPITIQPIQ